MTIKVSNIKDLEEAKLLTSYGVDILSFSILPEPNLAYLSYFHESRFLTIEQVRIIRQEIRGTKISVFIDLLGKNDLQECKMVDTVIQSCNLDYIECDSRIHLLPIPIIDQLSLSHDDRLTKFHEFGYNLRSGIPQVSLNELLSDWNWLKDESNKYPVGIKLSDVNGILQQHPNIILDFPMRLENCHEVLDHINAQTWNFTLGSKQDDERYYTTEEIIEITKVIKKRV